MPIQFTFRNPDTIQVDASGDVTFAELAVMLDELLDDPRVVAGSSILVDASQVHSAPSTPELRLFARDLAPLRMRGVVRMAVFSDSTFVYGVARMFGVFAELIDLRVAAFHRADEAEAWLASEALAA